jgi:hypothetical protein
MAYEPPHESHDKQKGKNTRKWGGDAAYNKKKKSAQYQKNQAPRYLRQLIKIFGNFFGSVQSAVARECDNKDSVLRIALYAQFR